MASEVTPGPHRVPAAEEADAPEPPFQTDLRFFTTNGGPETIHVTIDHSQPANVVTMHCLERLGYKPRQDELPTELSQLAAKAWPGYSGWQKLGLYNPAAHRGLSSDMDFVVVGDDYHCDLLLGRDFSRLNSRPRAGIYPNYMARKGKGTWAHAYQCI